MITNTSNRVAEIFTRYEQSILEDWMREQLAALTARQDLISEVDLRRQSAEFLAVLTPACWVGSFTDITTSEWNSVITKVTLADGLRHGPDATAAANLAVAIFAEQAPSSPAELLCLIHVGLRGTRGAAVVVAEIALGKSVVRYAGVGNIAGLILSVGTSSHLVSYNGTAGVEARKIQEFSYPWPEDGLLVLRSDRSATHWSLADYPGLAQKYPALIAGVLFRDHQRQRDESTVVVAKAAGRRVME